MTQNVQATEEKIETLDFIKITYFCVSGGSHQESEKSGKTHRVGENSCILNWIPVKTRKASFFPFYRWGSKTVVGQEPQVTPGLWVEEAGSEPRTVGCGTRASSPLYPLCLSAPPLPWFHLDDEGRGEGRWADPPKPITNSEAQPWPRKRGRKKLPFLPSVPTPAAACV